MPDWKSHIRPRLASLRFSPDREAEITEELAQHLEDRWRELVARGATPEEAAHSVGTEFDVPESKPSSEPCARRTCTKPRRRVRRARSRSTACSSICVMPSGH